MFARPQCGFRRLTGLKGKKILGLMSTAFLIEMSQKWESTKYHLIDFFKLRDSRLLFLYFRIYYNELTVIIFGSIKVFIIDEPTDTIDL